MGTKKSNKLYAAAAALAVTASAVAPGLTADAATKVTVKSVTNPASISHYGGYTFAVKKLSLPKTVKVLLSNKKYENRSVKWGKVSYDKKYIGKYQTISGTVSGTTKKASIKVKLNNYPVDVVEPKLAPVAVGEKLNLPSTIDVKYKDGKVIARSAKSFNLTAEKTDKAGMMKLSYNYMGKNSSIKGSIAYEVKAAEITNVMNEIKDDMLSVSADVKYPAKDAKAEVLVYAFKDMTKEPIKVAAELKDGKLTAKSAVLPAGTHAFAVQVGDVVSPAKDFVIEAPMVKEVKAINAKQLEVTFNKAVDASTLITDGTSVLKGLSIAGATGITYTASLSEDKKVLKVTANTSIDGKELIVNLAKETVKTVDGKFVESFLDRVVVKDTVAPSILGTEATTAQKVKVKFSEPMSSIPTPNFKYSDGTDVNVNIDVTQDASGEFVTLDLSNTDSKKSVVVEFIGAKDIAGNIISPNPSKVTVQKGDLDGIAPKVTMLDSLAPNKSVIQFSEVVYGLEASDFVGFTNVTDIKQDETDKTKYVFTHDALTGLKSVGLSASTVKDFSGETNAAFSKIVDYKADTIAPVLSSAKVARDSKDGVEYLTLSFNKDVKLLKDIVLTGISRKDGVTDDKASITLPVAKLSSVDNSKSTYRIALTNITTANTEYKLSLPADVVSNVSDVKNAAQANVISFTSLGDVKTVVQSVATNGVVVDETNNSTVTVEFAEAFDVASAEVASNYTIDGAVVKQAINKDPNKKIITLVLEENKTTFSGERNITVNGVKTASGVAMEKPFFGKLTLNENVAPKVVSAVLQQDLQTVVVTFDEALAPNATATDFEIYKGAETTALAEDATTPEVVEGKTVKIKLAAKTDSLDLKVKASKTLDLTDTLKNLVVFPEYIKVTAN